jgi:hypothetical protein
MMKLIERLYSTRPFRNIVLDGDWVSYEVWTIGFFPRFQFYGEAPVRDFVNFLIGVQAYEKR